MTYSCRKLRRTLLVPALLLSAGTGLVAAGTALVSGQERPTGREPTASADDVRTLAQMATKVNRPAGFPRLSDVCFSSRFQHPANDQDPHDSFRTAADFHATRFYWINGPNQAWFREIQRRGYPFQGWLSTILPDTLFGNTRAQGRILNAQGEPVTGPWMRSWKGWWGCLNSPEYRAVYLAYVKMYLDAGADSLQMDDPGENYTAVQWGGCFCPHCQAKAARLGKSPRDIQRESTEEFYRWIRAEMDAYAKRHVPFSCNSHPGDRYFFDAIFDFGVEELPEQLASAPLLYHAIRDAERRGKAQMFTFVSTRPSVTRATIALAYAGGSQVIVPWDVYVGTGVPRYFGEPGEYADLYGFARANAAFLDEYEDAAVLLPQHVDDRHARLPIAVRGGSQQLNLFVRAIPNRLDAPVVIHAVDTDEQPRAFRLGIQPARFFDGRPVTVDLLLPAPYDRAAHAQAEQAKQYASLSVRKRLAAGYVTEFDVPPLSPWGLIAIAPDPAARPGLWPPTITAADASEYTATLSVAIESATRHAVVRYTLDGTEPTAASAEYSHPLSVTADTLVKARSFVAAAVSPLTTVHFRKTPHFRTAISPATLPGLCLWLKADDLLSSHQAGEAIPRWPAQVGPPLIAEPVKLFDGQQAAAPVLDVRAIGQRPAVRFQSGRDLLVIRDFASEHLGGAFTCFLLTSAADPLFGACGNALNGNGGIPRLYLLREAFTYNASSLPLGVAPLVPAIQTYTHDGVDTVAAYVNGTRTGTASGAAYAAVGRFGGGHLAIPFWCGNTYHAGAVAEVIAFDRQLADPERAGIEQYLAEKYRLRTVKQWE